MPDPETITHSDLPEPTEPVKSSPRKSRWRLVLKVLLVLVLLVVAAGYWLLATKSGLSAVMTLARTLTDGKVVAQDVDGNLLGRLRIGRLHVDLQPGRADIDDLVLDWDPGALWKRSLHVRALTAAKVEIVQPDSTEKSEPLELPAELTLPLSIDIEQLRIEHLTQRNAEESPPALDLRSIAVALTSDGKVHRLPELTANLILEGGTIQARLRGELAGNSPFPLNINAEVSGDIDAEIAGESDKRHFALKADTTGDLKAIRFNLISEGLLNATANGVATPFDTRPFTEADISLTGFDPTQFVVDAPKALIDLQAHIAPQAEQGAGDSLATLPIAGTFDLINHQTGRLDQQLLPVQKVTGHLEWRDGALTVDRFVTVLADSRPIVADESANKPETGQSAEKPDKSDQRSVKAKPAQAKQAKVKPTKAKQTQAKPASTVATVVEEAPRQARIEGNLRYANDELNASVELIDLNALAFHSSAQPTHLSGPIDIRLHGEQLDVEAKLNDPRFKVRLDVNKTGQVVEFRRLSLVSTLDEAASLALNGKLQLGDNLTFDLTGKLEAFDPSYYVQSPPARLNALFNAKGNVNPDLRAKLDFDLTKSVFADLPAEGKGEINLEGNRLASSAIELRLGGNRLDVHGAFGQKNDQLTWKVNAPTLKVADILEGDVNGEGQISGGLENLALVFSLNAGQLKLPEGMVIRQLAADGNLGSTSKAPLQVKLKLAGLDSGDEKDLLSATSLDIGGNRQQHQVALSTGLTGKRQLELTADGGLDDRFNWQGMIQTLTLSGDQPLRLVSPASLNAGPAGAELLNVNLAGAGWTSRIERLRYVDGKLETAGKVGELPLSLVLPADLAEKSPLRQSSLRFDGNWLVSIPDASNPASWKGEINLARRDGDIVLALARDEETGAQKFDFDVLKAGVMLANGAVSTSLHAKGNQFGELHFDGGSKLANLRNGGDAVAEFNRSPWHGKLTLSVPSLAWLAPLASDGIEFDGRIDAQATLAGTPASPVLNGSIGADRLYVFLADQGFRLEQGTVDIALQGTRVHINRFEFFSPLEEKPAESRIDFEALKTASANARKITLSGDVDLSKLNGLLTLDVDQLPVLQKPDQWLMFSGQSHLKFDSGKLAAQGKFAVDAGYWKLVDVGTPQLSDDVQIAGRESKDEAPMPVSIDIEAGVGRQFYLQGAGVDTRLAGSIRVTGSRGQTPRAVGSIRTVGGNFDAYGTRLDIKRGIVNFHGLLDNPGLNIYASRQIQQVEAGVEVTGTVQRPLVKLVSTPVMPDAEILSWIVSGHGTEQGEGVDTSLLLSAASAILGDDGMSGSLKESLGIDEFSIDRGQLGGSSGQTSSRVAGGQGFGPSTSDGSSDQLLSAGKRISNNMVLGYEHSLGGLGSLVKLTVNLSRRLALVARTGSDNALDLTYSYSFGRKDSSAGQQAKSNP